MADVEVIDDDPVAVCIVHLALHQSGKDMVLEL
jgi:hypothetical protein